MLAQLDYFQRMYDGPFRMPRTIEQEIAAAEHEAEWLERMTPPDPVVVREVARLRRAAREMRERINGEA